MKTKKLMATLCLIGVGVMIIGNVIDSTTFWIFGDLYVGGVMAVVSYMLYKLN
jgi:hypothetical protein